MSKHKHEYKYSLPTQRCIVKIGNDHRPAGPDDIASMQKLIKKALKKNRKFIVTHHAVEIIVLPS